MKTIKFLTRSFVIIDVFHGVRVPLYKLPWMSLLINS